MRRSASLEPQPRPSIFADGSLLPRLVERRTLTARRSAQLNSIVDSRSAWHVARSFSERTPRQAPCQWLTEAIATSNGGAQFTGCVFPGCDLDCPSRMPGDLGEQTRDTLPRRIRCCGAADGLTRPAAAPSCSRSRTTRRERVCRNCSVSNDLYGRYRWSASTRRHPGNPPRPAPPIVSRRCGPRPGGRTFRG